jgi:uncharacterized glyoxalase superfamily protein PhnB
LVEAGATEIVPVEDRPYGKCEGRVRDPFGHLWIISHIIEDLSGVRSIVPAAHHRAW